MDGEARRFWFSLFGVLKFAVPVLYVAGAAFIWFVFSRTNPDGLANIWIAVYTLPVAMAGIFLLRREFPFVQGRYYEAHALYFWPSVVLLAAALFLVLHIMQKIVQPNVPANAQKTARRPSNVSRMR